jgi:inhibitor of cysteine peptidase
VSVKLLRRSLALLVSAAVAGGGAAAVLAFAGSDAGGAVVGIGEQLAGTTVRLHRDDTLVVSLGANASTGYSWRTASVDRKVLRPDSTAYVAPMNRARVGASGVAVLTFKAVAAGRTVLKLAYVGPGRHPPTGRRFTVSVVVF